MPDKYEEFDDDYADLESFEPIERGMRREGEGEAPRKKNKKKFNKQAREAKEFKPIYVEEEYGD